MSIVTHLDPSICYRFQTMPSGMTAPMFANEFLCLPNADEKLVAVFRSDNLVWSSFESWLATPLNELVTSFITFIDRSAKVENDFIDVLLATDTPPMKAVIDYFHGDDVSIYRFEHHLSGLTKLIDIDLEGVSSVRRVVLPMDIKQGDLFNVYYGTNAKGGAKWTGDIVTSLKCFFEPEQSEVAA